MVTRICGYRISKMDYVWIATAAENYGDGIADCATSHRRAPGGPDCSGDRRVAARRGPMTGPPAARRVYEKAPPIMGGHPHRFHDTLAVELLLDGMPIERVHPAGALVREDRTTPRGYRHVRINSNRTWCAHGATTPLRRRRCFAPTPLPRAAAARKWRRHIRDTKRAWPLTK